MIALILGCVAVGSALVIVGLAARRLTGRMNDRYEKGRRHQLTLRDWFAGLALAGMLADESGDGEGSYYPPKVAAKRAYGFADAMLAARMIATVGGGANDGQIR